MKGIIMNQTILDLRFMKLAHHVSEWSEERGRHVGAVIIGPNNEIRSTGYNRIPIGVRTDIELRHLTENGEKYIWSSHAEQNAIFEAAKHGVCTVNCTMYIPWFPCSECAKAIIGSGIKAIVAYEPDFNDFRWGKLFVISLTMLNEAGVEIRYLKKVV
jgi:dCMP deaminase